MDDSKRGELLLEHYRDTFEHLLYHWRFRNRLFIFILVLLGVIALDCITVPLPKMDWEAMKLVETEKEPVEKQERLLSSLVNAYLRSKLDLTDEQTDLLSFAVIDLIARFLLLSLVVEYYRRSIHVDRQYRYVASLEDRACELMGGDYIRREGRAYFSKKGVPGPGEKDERPVFLRWVAPLYVYVFPIALIALVTWKTIERDLAFRNPVMDILSLLSSAGIVVYSVLYMVWVKRKA